MVREVDEAGEEEEMEVEVDEEAEEEEEEEAGVKVGATDSAAAGRDGVGLEKDRMAVSCERA